MSKRVAGRSGRGVAPRPLHRVLVANRGEIAVRIITACRELGISSVAVASAADRLALHTQLADQVVEIGPPAPRDSYLRIERLLDAARATGCDGVHPGYGFLAENAAFARACADQGLTFIGPTAEAIEAMGSKTAARARMEAAGVPVVPGGLLPDSDDESAWRAAARSVGYPLLVKAAAGGGGKGMRRVEDEAELAGAVGAARREAAAAFGDATVYLERLLASPRHIEVQVFGDHHGNVLHLGERECSIQRRHQKIIEESPAPELDRALAARMHDTAVRAARAVGYVNAGTIEMLLDASGAFYFLEMNTRLQVEHPVTEWVTGVDMVALQIRVAQGEPLRLSEHDVQPRGHAVEARLYAEDPAAGFVPQTGPVLLFEAPRGPGVRVDTGITTGAEVSLHYDPMVAKLSAWGADRDAARRRLLEALRETVLLGVRSNREYLMAILAHPQFAAGRTHTGFLEQHLPDWRSAQASDHQALLAAAAVLLSAPTGLASAGSGAPAPGDPAVGAAGGPGAPAAGVWASLGPLRMGERG